MGTKATHQLRGSSQLHPVKPAAAQAVAAPPVKSTSSGAPVKSY